MSSNYFERLYFDPQIVIFKKRTNEYIIYSPSTDSYFKGNKPTKILVEILVKNDGRIDLLRIKNLLNDFYNIKVTEDELLKTFISLVTTNVFFSSHSSYINAVLKVQEQKKNKRINYTHAYLHLTYNCNLNCWFCYNREIRIKHFSLKDELSNKDWKDIIQRLYDIGIKYFTVTGGEPFLRDDIYDILEYGYTLQQCHFEIFTNGTVEISIDNILKLDKVINRIVFSISDTFLNLRDDFKNIIINNIAILNEHFPQKVYIRCVITKQIEDQIWILKEMFKKEFNIKNFIISIFVPNTKEETIFLPDFDKILKYDETRLLEEENYTEIPLKVNCGAATSELSVDPKGDLYPCQMLTGYEEFKIGSMLSDRWKSELFNSPVVKMFQSLSVDLKEKCKDCSFRYFCNGGCPAISLKLYGNLCSYNKIFCKLNKKRTICILTKSNIL